MSGVSKKAVLTVLALIFAASLLGLRITHPHGGLTHALGSAESSLVVYKATKDLSAGDKAIVVSGDKSISPVLGVVTAISDDTYSTNNGSVTESVQRIDVQGRVLFVIPFLGSVLGIIGQ